MPRRPPGGNVIGTSALFVATLLAAVLFCGSAAFAQQDLRGDPGFIDFSQQATLGDADLEIHISIKDPMIKLVAEASRERDPALAEVLESLRAVEVHVYNVPVGGRETIREEIGQKARQLERKGWTEAITIRMKDARGHVFLRLVEDKPAGLAAMYLDDSKADAVFVNIVGQIDAAQVGRLADQFNFKLLGEALTGTSSNSGD